MQLEGLLALRDTSVVGRALLANRKLSKRLTFAGMEISIETAKGETRSGIKKNGTKWSVTMPFDYGYIRGTMGPDGDHVDCFIGPDEDADEVYVIHQSVDGKPDKWDEDKCFLGFASADAAKKAYQKAYDNGGAFYHSMSAMPLDEFKRRVFATKDKVRHDKLHAMSPPGFGGTTEHMTKHKDISNPYRLAWWQYEHGDKSHKKAPKGSGAKTVSKKVRKVRRIALKRKAKMQADFNPDEERDSKGEWTQGGDTPAEDMGPDKWSGQEYSGDNSKPLTDQNGDKIQLSDTYYHGSPGKYSVLSASPVIFLTPVSKFAAFHGKQVHEVHVRELVGYRSDLKIYMMHGNTIDDIHSRSRFVSGLKRKGYSGAISADGATLAWFTNVTPSKIKTVGTKMQADFDEALHPRDAEGKFTDNGSPQLTPASKHVALKGMGFYLKQGSSVKDIYEHAKSGIQVHVSKYNTTHAGNANLRKYAIVNPKTGKTLVQGHQFSKISQGMSNIIIPKSEMPKIPGEKPAQQKEAPSVDKTPGGLPVVGLEKDIQQLKDAGYTPVDKSDQPAEGVSSLTQTLWTKPDASHDFVTTTSLSWHSFDKEKGNYDDSGPKDTSTKTLSDKLQEVSKGSGQKTEEAPSAAETIMKQLSDEQPSVPTPASTSPVNTGSGATDTLTDAGFIHTATNGNVDTWTHPGGVTVEYGKGQSATAVVKDASGKTVAQWGGVMVHKNELADFTSGKPPAGGKTEQPSSGIQKVSDAAKTQTGVGLPGLWNQKLILQQAGFKPVDKSDGKTTWAKEGNKYTYTTAPGGWTKNNQFGSVVKSGSVASKGFKDAVKQSAAATQGTGITKAWNGKQYDITPTGKETAAQPPAPKLPEGTTKNSSGPTIPATGKQNTLSGLGFKYAGTTTEGHDMYTKDGSNLVIKLSPSDPTHTDWTGTNSKNGQTSTGKDAGSMASWINEQEPQKSTSSPSSGPSKPVSNDPAAPYNMTTDKAWQENAKSTVADLWSKASASDKKFDISGGGVYGKITQALGVPWKAMTDLKDKIGSWQGGNTVQGGNKVGEWAQQIVNGENSVHPGLYVEHLVSMQRIQDSGGKVPALSRGLSSSSDAQHAAPTATSANVQAIKNFMKTNPDEYVFKVPMYGAEGFTSAKDVAKSFGGGGMVIEKPEGSIPPEWVMSSRDLNPNMWTGYAGEHEWAIAAPGAKMPIDWFKGDRIHAAADSNQSQTLEQLLQQLKDSGWDYEIDGRDVTIIPPADMTNENWFKWARNPKRKAAPGIESFAVVAGVPPIVLEGSKAGFRVGRFRNGEACVIGAENGATGAYIAFPCGDLAGCILLGFASPVRARMAYKQVFSAEAPGLRAYSLIGVAAAVKRGLPVIKPKVATVSEEDENDDTEDDQTTVGRPGTQWFMTETVDSSREVRLHGDVIADFNEEDHPRGDDGKFTTVGGSDKVEQWKSGQTDERKLNGVSMKKEDKPDFDKLVNPSLKEPPLPALPSHQVSYKDKDGNIHTYTSTKHAAAGVIVVEPDGRVWLYSPKNFYGGYKNTFSKGTLDKGDTPQHAAVRELHEETGLLAKVKGYLGDVERDTSVTRYYIGKRVGGAPWAHNGEETHAVKLVPIDNTLRYRLADLGGNRTADHQVLQLLNKKLGINVKT